MRRLTTMMLLLCHLLAGCSQGPAPMLNMDYADVWLTQQENIIGYIGDNYQRFYIHFDQICRDTVPTRYRITGKTKTATNICNFEGSVEVIGINEVQKGPDLAANDTTDREILRCNYGKCELLALVEICEARAQFGSGTISGILKSFFYIRGGKPCFDDMEQEFSDGFCNNQFVGEWTSFRTGAKKKCCWGTYRIPDCGDLDIGAAEFHPNPKYVGNGWELLQKAYETGDSADWARECEAWWE